DNPAITVLSGTERINHALTEAMIEASRELLSIQPTTQQSEARTETAQALALDRDQALLDRGGRIRTLYQHTQRYRPLVMARYEHLRGDAEARTLDEVTDRLIVIDREVAFIPANKDRTLALEIRHEALVGYFVTTFERLWRLAIPLTAPLPDTGIEGISHREQSIAALLAEGHQDAVIAERLGISVRTCRAHIARLSETLGAASRTQLGVRIAQVGLDGPRASSSDAAGSAVIP
ncbi:LuxR family transcriptional regulator, partial [Streptomyces sp. uw30]|uniref:helix-turn-helix transcriptional regulator n=1 Tax=Streptomyces sp. uw30 TaxID=1828179 RepID=UPI0011CDD26A